MNQPIQDLKLHFACNENWDTMSPCALGKFCDSCQKSVHDFSDKSQDDLINALAGSEGRICGRFTSEQVSNKPSYFGYLKKALAAAALFFGLSVNLKAQDTIIEMRVGELPMAYPVYVNHGQPGLKHFLKENIDLSDNTTNGKVLAFYTIGKNGSVVQVRIEKGLNAEVNQKILNALKQVAFSWEVEEGYPEAGMPQQYQLERKVEFTIQQDKMEIEFGYWYQD